MAIDNKVFIRSPNIVVALNGGAAPLISFFDSFLNYLFKEQLKENSVFFIFRQEIMRLAPDLGGTTNLLIFPENSLN